MRVSPRRPLILSALAAVLLAVGLTAPAVTASAPAEDTALSSSARSIPTPKSYFGFAMGTTGKLATNDRMLSYLRLASDRSNRVDYHVAGKTTMGNDYAYLTISSPRNLRNIERLAAINRRLSDPRGLSEGEARSLARQGKPFLMIQAAIHSTEVGNTQALMDVVHRLATEESDYTKRVLDNAVLIVVPSQNPDGTKLVNDYFNETAGTSYKRVYPDLYHKYTGHDDNRDWFMFTQVEPRYYIGLIARYRPSAVHILHQMGPTGDRLFVPPYKDPFDPSIDPRVVQTTSELGLGMGGAVSREGKKGVSWSSTYDWWLPSVFYEPYHGIPNVLTEIAAARDLAYPYTSADGKPLGSQDQRTNFVAPYDSATWTLEQIVAYAKTATYANIDNVGKKGEDLLYNMYQVSRDNLNWSAEPYAYVVPAGQRDPYAAYELLNILKTGQIEIERASAPFTANGKRYPAGSHVVRMRQPYSRWADSLLKIWEYPEIRACDTCPVVRPYDVTGHTLWMLFGASVDKVAKPFSASLQRVDQVRPAAAPMPPAPRGAYLVQPTSYGVGRFLAALQKAGVPTFRAAKRFTSGGTGFAPGTLVVPPTDQARRALASVSQQTGIQVHAADRAPDVKGFQLKDGTRIGLFRGANNMPGGWLWWMFEQYGVNFRNMGAGDFTGDLNDRYDTIVLPQGISKNTVVNGLKKADYPSGSTGRPGSARTASRNCATSSRTAARSSPSAAPRRPRGSSSTCPSRTPCPTRATTSSSPAPSSTRTSTARTPWRGGCRNAGRSGSTPATPRSTCSTRPRRGWRRSTRPPATSCAAGTARAPGSCTASPTWRRSTSARARP
ncbi:M14 family zinc carboxypeptidase [Actinomadura sp. J1-007]|uniref:M14 family zinc carboxypeptidase n=1 Tax=Actinomadura sp. J1-007 TaxID=2661913 RepID=UPI0013709754|nr:M14 family zinc carboxypeptidase [Actinomadura sp. J1-007]